MGNSFTQPSCLASPDSRYAGYFEVVSFSVCGEQPECSRRLKQFQVLERISSGANTIRSRITIYNYSSTKTKTKAQIDDLATKVGKFVSLYDVLKSPKHEGHILDFV